MSKDRHGAIEYSHLPVAERPSPADVIAQLTEAAGRGGPG